MKRSLILIPFIFPLQGCNEATATSVAQIAEYEILHESNTNQYAATTSKSALVIRNQSEYDDELLKRSSDNVKAVDFATESVVLIDMGTRATGGYAIDIQSIVVETNNVRLNVLLTFPSEGCGTSQAITNPYKLIKVRTTE